MFAGDAAASRSASRAGSAPSRRRRRCAGHRGTCRASGRRHCGCSAPGSSPAPPHRRSGLRPDTACPGGSATIAKPVGTGGSLGFRRSADRSSSAARPAAGSRRAAAMVTNTRSSDCALGMPLVGTLGSGVASGGCSDGHRKARSMRSCAPGWRCIGTRIAAGGTLKATPADRDRQRRRIRSERRALPARPQHCRMKPVAAATGHADRDQWQRQQAAMPLAPAWRVSAERT